MEIKSDSPPLRLARDYRLKRGQTVVAIGNPGVGQGFVKLENAVSRGVVSTEFSDGAGKLMQLNISVNPGNSGSPVIAPTGEVIGLLNGRATLQEAIATAIPVADLVAAIERVKQMTQINKAEMTSRSNTRAVFIRTTKAARVCSIGTIHIHEQWNNAIARVGRVTKADFDTARNAFMEALRAQRQEHLLDMRDIEQAVTLVGTNTRLNETTRQRLADLWKTYDALRLDFESPIGTMEEYKMRSDRNQISLEDLSGGLRVMLGVEQAELAIALK